MIRAEVSNDRRPLETAAVQYEHASVAERHPDWPRLDVHFYFAPHTTYEDMEGIEPLIADADMFLYEDTGSDESVEAVYNVIASPSTGLTYDEIIATFEQYLPIVGTVDEAIVRGLYMSGTVAAPVDIGRTDVEQELAEQVRSVYEDTFQLCDNYDDTVASYRDRFAGIAKIQSEREKLIAENFESKIADVFAKHPELIDKPAVKILVSIGSIHTPLRHALTQIGIPSTREFSTDMPYVYNYGSELQRTFAYGKEPSEDLIARALVESVIGMSTRMLCGTTVTYDEYMAYERKVVSDLTPGQVKGIIKRYGSGRVRMDYLDGVLKRSGYRRLPSNREELQRIINGPNKRQWLLAKTALKEQAAQPSL